MKVPTKEKEHKPCSKCDDAGFLCDHPELPFYSDECTEDKED